MMTSKEKRDFIAHEIVKRIIGPGYTEDVFLCQPNASDEILDNRPTVVYTGGILYPRLSQGTDADSIADDANDVNNTDEQPLDVVTEAETDNSDATEDVDDNQSNISKTQADNQLDLGIADRADFKPSHIGLVTCVKPETQTIDVSVKYGIYHMLNETRQDENNNVLQNVKVKLGRCSLEQLRRTFDYYDHYDNLITEIGLFGANCMNDLFFIDEDKFTISPRRIFSREDENGKTKYLQSTSFPKLPRNKVAAMLIDLMSNPAEPKELPVGLTLNCVQQEIRVIEALPEMTKILNVNQWQNILDNLTFEGDNVRITYGTFTIPEGIQFREIMFVDDPVYNHLLPLLLQYRFFKREQMVLDTFTLDLNGESSQYLLPDSNNALRLNWKVMLRNDNQGLERKYVKVLLSNVRIRNNRQQTEDFIHQSELKISSPGIVSYAEPHRSSIADTEYDTNELLYSDIEVYAKGVNCGATWNIDNGTKEVMTTYAPQQVAVAFNPDSEYDSIRNACDVFDLTLWSDCSRDDILNKFSCMAERYEEWTGQQHTIAAGKDVLKDILQEQDDFLQRLNDNIEYLRTHDNAFRCFQIANTAMYIQMLISRDPYFKKNREKADIPENDFFDDTHLWTRFSEGRCEYHPKYRPFQLAFLLMNVMSTFEDDDPYRNNNVDLIWFPTGGGKTEAYLALTAMTIAQRRMSHLDDDGISVVMRYTLRLLTAQQFERASFLICALEYLRQHLANEGDNSLGNQPITIGMWIGKASSPNKWADLDIGNYSKFSNYLRGNNNGSSRNPFPISYCPWCGCKMITSGVNNRFISGYDRLYDSRNNNRDIHCINERCCFSQNLPIRFVDEQLYDNPPTLLFATVDKFAQLKDSNTGRMFGCNVEGRRKPDLIIQDELHLISGPLGSLVGMYETMVEEVCTERDDDGNVIRRPKIIASTATTRNTKNLIKQLYVRNVRAFPVSGISYNDNFFSKALDLNECKRLYLGLSPTGHSASELEIRSIAAQIVAKERLIAKELISLGCDMNDREQVANYLVGNAQPYSLLSDIDDYWTLVLYYNNLKSLGRAHSRIGQEIKSNAESMRRYLDEYPSLDFINSGFHHRTEEFTSRQESSRIKELLVQAEARTSLDRYSNHKVRVTSRMDIVQATNMISVGIDIERWNTMMMIGQPLTTAEYIQSSSRVGRKKDGLVINLYNPLRLRELSLYENYLPYHKVFYKHVEPLMATTFTEQTIKKLVTNLYFCYMRACKGYEQNDDVRDYDVNSLKDLLRTRAERTGVGQQFIEYLQRLVDEVREDCGNRIYSQIQGFTYPIMNSLRDIESNTYISYN